MIFCNDLPLSVILKIYEVLQKACKRFLPLEAVGGCWMYSMKIGNYSSISILEWFRQFKICGLVLGVEMKTYINTHTKTLIPITAICTLTGTNPLMLLCSLLLSTLQLSSMKGLFSITYCGHQRYCREDTWSKQEKDKTIAEIIDASSGLLSSFYVQQLQSKVAACSSIYRPHGQYRARHWWIRSLCCFSQRFRGLE